MTLTATVLTQGHVDFNYNQVSLMTASVTPTAKKLQLLFVTGVCLTGTPNAVPSLVAGNGLVWSQLVTQSVVSPNTTNVTIFGAMGASTATDKITITFPQAQGIVIWGLVEFGGIKGPTAVGAIPQTVKNSGTNLNNATLTFGNPFGSTSNMTVGVISWSNALAGGFPTPGPGMTALFSEREASNDGMQVQWSTANVNTVEWDANLGANIINGRIALEGIAGSSLIPLPGAQGSLTQPFRIPYYRPFARSQA